MNESETTYVLDTSALLTFIEDEAGADAWIAALALERNAILIHKDPEFDQTEDEFEVLRLPYKDR